MPPQTAARQTGAAPQGYRLPASSPRLFTGSTSMGDTDAAARAHELAISYRTGEALAAFERPAPGGGPGRQPRRPAAHPDLACRRPDVLGRCGDDRAQRTRRRRRRGGRPGARVRQPRLGSAQPSRSERETVSGPFAGAISVRDPLTDKSRQTGSGSCGSLRLAGAPLTGERRPGTKAGLGSLNRWPTWQPRILRCAGRRRFFAEAPPLNLLEDRYHANQRRVPGAREGSARRVVV